MIHDDGKFGVAMGIGNNRVLLVVLDLSDAVGLDGYIDSYTCLSDLYGSHRRWKV